MSAAVDAIGRGLRRGFMSGFVFPASHIVERLTLRGVLGIAVKHAQRAGVSVEDICGRGRTQSVASARHAVWRELQGKGLSLSEIGCLFDRDHTTVLAALNPVRRAKSKERTRQRYLRSKVQA